jgi:phage gp45-like
MKFSERAGELWATLTDLARRIFPRNTSDVLRWTTLGYDDEEDTIEVFHGLGYAARPRANANAEAIAVAVNASDHHVIVATRDAALLEQVVKEAGLDQGETLAGFSEGAVIKVRENTVEVRAPNGTAVRLATLDDIQALRDYVASHVHPVTAAPGTTGTSTPPPGQPSGTTVLKGQ